MNEDCFATKVRKKYLTKESFPNYVETGYSMDEQERREKVLNTFLECVTYHIVAMLYCAGDNMGTIEELRSLRSWFAGSVMMSEEYATAICNFIQLCMEVVGREFDGITEFMERLPNVICESSSLEETKESHIELPD